MRLVRLIKTNKCHKMTDLHLLLLWYLPWQGRGWWDNLKGPWVRVGKLH